jgi:hypothetical protein
MAQAGIFQLVTNREKLKKTYYACEIVPIQNSESVYNTGGDWLRQLVVNTSGDMSKVLVHDRPAKCIQVQPSWWIVITDCIFADNMHYTVRGLPTPNRIWINQEMWDIKEHCSRIRGEAVTRPLPPIIREIIHINKLQQGMNMHIATDITWTGVPWNKPVVLRVNGVILFEIPDQESRMAMEIMCGGKSIFHLGNCFRVRRTDWINTVKASNQRAFDGIMAKM